MMTAAAALSVLPQSHAFELNDLVRRKLDCPGTQLSPAESRSCLVSCIRHGKAAARLAERAEDDDAEDGAEWRAQEAQAERWWREARARGGHDAAGAEVDLMGA